MYKELASELGWTYLDAHIRLMRLLRALDAVDCYFSGGERSNEYDCFYAEATNVPGSGMKRRSRIVTDPLPDIDNDTDEVLN